mgnify:CR=1 FL=1
MELNAKVGATVTGGMIMGESDTSGGKQCMQIADLSKMKVTVQVGEKDIAKIAVGQSANVTYPAFPDIVSQGTVTAIASVANSDAANGGGSVTFNVDILIEAPDARLKPGMTAEVSVVTEQLDDVVMVPTMALMTEDGEHYYVNVATDDEGKQTRRVKVPVVTQNDNETVVGKTQVKRDDQGNEINPTCRLPSCAMVTPSSWTPERTQRLTAATARIRAVCLPMRTCNASRYRHPQRAPHL